MKHILVVCTANICRSPAAEMILSQKFTSLGLKVESAGTQAVAGFPADPTIQALIQEKGFASLEGHQSKPIMPSLLSQSDLVLCMERSHMQYILSMNPVLVSKVKLYAHWHGQNDVADPIGRSRDTYARCIDEIEQMADVWYEKIMKSGLIRT